MSKNNSAYVRQHYKVPAEVGRLIIADGEPGVILADRGQYIGVVLDSDSKKRIRNYHPTWEMQYGEMAEKLPLKKWKVLPFNLGWDELSWNRDALGYLTEGRNDRKICSRSKGQKDNTNSLKWHKEPVRNDL